MNKQPTTVFVQVSYPENKPDEAIRYTIFSTYVGIDTAFWNGVGFGAYDEYVTAWLKPLPASIVLSVEEYEKLNPMGYNKGFKIHETFFRRLLMFVSDVIVSDLINEEEKQFIIHTANQNL